MNRPIKFRAWNKEAKQWIKDKDFIITSTGKVISIHGHTMMMDITERVTLCQFTGLTDKNGKEIYEGDILASGETKWEVYGDNSKMKFGLRNENTYDFAFERFCEVIGNVYENPELLKS